MTALVSCCLSAAGLRFLGILSRPGLVPLSRSAYRAPRRRRGPERVFHVPHARDTAGIGCSLYPGDDGAHTARHNPQPPPAAFQRPAPVIPASRPVPGCAINEASARVHWRSPPPGLPLACAPRTDRGPLGFPVSSAPASPGDRHARHGGDRSYGADPDYVFGMKPNLQSTYSLATCDLMSQLWYCLIVVCL